MFGGALIINEALPRHTAPLPMILIGRQLVGGGLGQGSEFLSSGDSRTLPTASGWRRPHGEDSRPVVDSHREPAQSNALWSLRIYLRADRAITCTFRGGSAFTCDPYAPVELEDPPNALDDDCDGLVDEAPLECGVCGSEPPYFSPCDSELVEEGGMVRCGEQACATLEDCCAQNNREFTPDGCGGCVERFTGERCDTCTERYTGPDCSQCAERFAGENCEQCAPRFSGDDCSQCLERFAGVNCDECAPRFAGATCDECAPRFAGENCEQCAPRFQGEGCADCSPGHSGANCAVETCGDNVQTPSEECDDGVNDGQSGCFQCRTVTADNCGDADCSRGGTRRGWASDLLPQTAKLNAFDAAAGDLFGYSVAISGDTAIVGGRNDDDGGKTAVRPIFTRGADGSGVKPETHRRRCRGW